MTKIHLIQNDMSKVSNQDQLFCFIRNHYLLDVRLHQAAVNIYHYDCYVGSQTSYYEILRNGHKDNTDSS